ncbi:MAG: MBL fold metallo-hydrolase [Pirellulales bacterium]|nr:MBL fold metallo-hydrolase [Pirellulales bacterium]
MIGCGCTTCTSDNPKNVRTRASVVLGLPEGNVLIDTTPELRVQLLREKIGLAHAVFYTHAHADHLFGLDDLRIFHHYLEGELPLFCEENVEQRIRATFDYAFDPVVQAYPAGGVPRLEFRRIATEPFEVLGAEVTPVRLRHGQADILGFRLGNVAYCTDAKEIPPQSMAKLEGLDVLILGCLRHKPHISHMNVEEAVETARRLAPKRTLFTHMCHHLDHDETNRALPDGMELAYDGMVVSLT